MIVGTVATAAVLERDLQAVRTCLEAGLLEEAARGLLQVERFVGLLPDDHPIRAETAQLVQEYKQAAAR